MQFFLGKREKSRVRQKPHELMHQPNILRLGECANKGEKKEFPTSFCSMVVTTDVPANSISFFIHIPEMIIKTMDVLLLMRRDGAFRTRENDDIFPRER
jgi:hypothetical protein